MNSKLENCLYKIYLFSKFYSPRTNDNRQGVKHFFTLVKSCLTTLVEKTSNPSQLINKSVHMVKEKQNKKMN